MSATGNQPIQRRNTRQRALVLTAVQDRCDHPTADAIYEDIHAIDERISRATVYRNLNLLAEEGSIRIVKTPHGSRFDLRCDCHAHVQCSLCKCVVDAELPIGDGLDTAVAELTGYTITNHEILFEGLCPACQARIGQKRTIA